MAPTHYYDSGKRSVSKAWQESKNHKQPAQFFHVTTFNATQKKSVTIFDGGLTRESSRLHNNDCKDIHLHLVASSVQDVKVRIVPHWIPTRGVGCVIHELF